jgi:hypothetical protein
MMSSLKQVTEQERTINPLLPFVTFVILIGWLFLTQPVHDIYGNIAWSPGFILILFSFFIFSRQPIKSRKPIFIAFFLTFIIHLPFWAWGGAPTTVKNARLILPLFGYYLPALFIFRRKSILLGLSIIVLLSLMGGYWQEYFFSTAILKWDWVESYGTRQWIINEYLGALYVMGVLWSLHFLLATIAARFVDREW